MCFEHDVCSWCNVANYQWHTQVNSFWKPTSVHQIGGGHSRGCFWPLFDVFRPSSRVLVKWWLGRMVEDESYTNDQCLNAVVSQTFRLISLSCIHVRCVSYLLTRVYFSMLLWCFAAETEVLIGATHGHGMGWAGGNRSSMLSRRWSERACGRIMRGTVTYTVMARGCDVPKDNKVSNNIS